MQSIKIFINVSKYLAYRLIGDNVLVCSLEFHWLYLCIFISIFTFHSRYANFSLLSQLKVAVKQAIVFTLPWQPKTWA